MKTLELPSGEQALIDDADHEAVMQHKWHIVKDDHRRYVIRNIKKPGGGQTSQSLHRFLLNPGAGVMIDHKDGNGLNNQRDNLRAGTAIDNQRAFQTKRKNCTSKFRGVYWDKYKNIWFASICLKIQGKTNHVYKQAFASEEEAAMAFNRAAEALGYKPEALNKVA